MARSTFRPAPRIIALSGYGAPDDVRRALEAGCDAHLLKPCDPETLAAMIERYTGPAAKRQRSS